MLGIHNGRKQFPVSYTLKSWSFSLSEGLTGTDLGFRNTRESVSACSWVRKWRGHCHQRRSNTRPRRQAKNRFRVRGADNRSRVSRRSKHYTLPRNYWAYSYLDDNGKRARTASKSLGRYWVWRWLYDI